MSGVFPRLTASARPVAYKTYGMDFSPYVDGQDPNFETQISEAQLTARLQIIANNTVWVRSFGCTHGLEKFGMVAHGLGLKAAVGAWLSRNSATNDQEIANLITAANAGQVDLAIVGSEVLLRNDLTASQLIGYMNQVRQQIPSNIPVTTADVYFKLLENPSVIANSDVVLANYYPYWEGVSINISIATLHRQHQQVVAAAAGKTVIVSETGWPSAGNTICNAVPSPTNASLYFLNFVSWARANNVTYFYFDALDEAWKANHGEGPQGAHWGVWDKDGVLKPGMQAVFDGQTMPDNWTNAGIPGGPGTPTIEFTSVPPYGSSNNLFGQVLHVNTDDYKVAVYIRVGSGWWTKPTFDGPSTNIALTGSWECDITTGGNDVLANQIAAFLIPASFTPPRMDGGPTLPPSLDQNSVARADVARSSTALNIVGRVTDSLGQGLSCVTIALSGSQSATSHTVGNGEYSFINLQPGGDYTVTPSHPSYIFNPPNWTFNNLTSNQTGDFVATPSTATITLSASPSAGGTVSGGGTFQAGSSRTVTATANSGYSFVNWTENGGVVSTSTSYTFTLNGNRTLVANFSPVNYTITLSASPSAGGTVSGGGTFQSGSSRTVTATANSGYSFVNWTEGGNVVSQSSTYTFSLNGNRSLVAQFVPVRSKKTGVFRPSTGELFLKNANSSGFADTYIIFGNPGDYPIAGDWNGDGVDSVGIYRNGIFYLRNTNSTGFADIVVAFGNPSDQPVVGDWNGDGVDTIGVYRNGTFILRNSNTAGPPDLVFTLGNPGDVGIAGDWNGDGVTTCGVFRPSNGIIYLKNSNSTGFADLSFVFGNAGDKPVAGDWNADGIDTIGIYRNGQFYLSNSNATGFADMVFALGNNGDFPIAGNWNGSP